MLALAIVAVAMALPLRDLFRHQGPPMEEGFMLVFPERVLKGAIPNKDFLHLYGPGSLWALAGWFKVAGVSLASERFFGLVQHAGIVFGVFFLALPWGRRVATSAALVSTVITLSAIGLTALAWNGAVALGLLALNLGIRARRRALGDATTIADRSDLAAAADRRQVRGLFVAGVVGGLALTFRPDLVVAVVLSSAVVAGRWGTVPQRLKAMFAGIVAGASLYVIHLAIAGPGRGIQGMLFDPVFRLRAGRSLPRPPSWDQYDGALQRVAQLVPTPWSLPAIDGPKQVVLWFFALPVMAVAITVVGWRRVKAEPESSRARALLAAGVFCLGMMPQAFQRPDTTHLAWVSCVTFALAPVLLAELLRGRLTARPALRSLAPGAVTFLALFLLIPYFTYRPYVDLVRKVGSPSPSGYTVNRGDRNFYLGSEPITPAAKAIIRDLDARVKPGQRLLVGSLDLRKTNYSDAYLYYLYPELTPATYYIEMDPGVANRAGSGLAGEVARSDWLVLSSVWDQWHEANTSEDFGSDAPNRVVRKHFCLVREYGFHGDPGKRKPYFQLWRRSDRVNPERATPMRCPPPA